MSDNQFIDKIYQELSEGMGLKKCRQCGCMKDALDQLKSISKEHLHEGIEELIAAANTWMDEMQEIKYSCLGCDYCYPAVAINMMNKSFPDRQQVTSADCAFDLRENTWPPVPGEYFVLGNGPEFPVAVSTLASPDLVQLLADKKPEGLSIVGKTETENIGIDKLVKNVINNSSLKLLVLAGKEPDRHFSGDALLSLWQNGVNKKMKVIGAKGAQPVLKNVTVEEVEAFREQVKLVDMIGCEDVGKLLERISVLSSEVKSSCKCTTCDEEKIPSNTQYVPVIQASTGKNIKLDKSGYFVILPVKEKGSLLVEHYTYDNRLERIIEGKTTREIYLTIIENEWVSQLDHAAYLGKELARAEAELIHSIPFVQDSA